MKKYFHALPGNLEIAKGKTIKATILGREKSSILVQLENGMFATIDFDNVFMKCGPNVWPRFISAKSRFEQTKVRITHITHDFKIKVVPWGRYERYAKRAKAIMDTLITLNELKKNVTETYFSMQMYEEPRLNNFLFYIENKLNNETDEEKKETLISQKERILDTLELIRGKKEFIAEATREILDGEELLREFNLMENAS